MAGKINIPLLNTAKLAAFAENDGEDKDPNQST
jgi:hypothetical protein